MELRRQQEEEQLLWNSNAQPESMVTVTLGRVMSTLLTARPKKLQDSISRLSADHKTTSLGSLEQSLWFLYKYVRDAAERDDILDEILVPMVEHSLTSKESKHGGQAMILLDWLFKDELLFQVLATNLANIITRKDDRYLNLGWCTLVRGLLEYESAMDQHLLNGIREKYDVILRILCSSIPQLTYIVCRGSTMQDGFELPSRLSVSAADCFLSLTEALTKKPKVLTDNKKSSSSKALDRPSTLITSATGEKKVKPVHESSRMETEFLLWNHLQELIILVEKLLAWSRKSRTLHAKGLEKVLKWLQEIKELYGGIQDETGSKPLKSGALLLSSCWKHYGMLTHLEDHKFSKQYKELLDQYISGIEYYTDNQSRGHMDGKDGIETRRFFLNCICLLLGRVDGKKFESIMSEYGRQMLHVLSLQLHCHDEDVIDVVVCIFKVALFWKNNSPGSSLTESRQMGSLLPLLLHLLDERDGAARAVTMLVAEYCSMSADGHCLQEILKRLTSGNVIRRRNALDVLSELVHISSHLVNANSHLAWQDIANHLLELLGDEETVIREQTLNLIPMIDPSLTLPALVRLVYSSDENIKSSASVACVGMLKYHNQKYEVICMLLDCLSNLSKSLDLPVTAGYTRDGSKLDNDQLLMLIPQWSESVQDWNSLVGPLIDKMFAEPSNAIMVRFLSCISEHLADAADVVLHRVLLQMKGQKEIDESVSKWECRTHTSDESVQMQQSLFERLCPLLIIKLLPLRVFDDLNSYIMYGQHLSEKSVCGGNMNIIDHECIAACLLNRAFSKFEFEDVRKLAAELCGRIRPQVLLPTASAQLQHAAGSQDVLKIKACLFSVCTSVVVRGKDSVLHPAMPEIRNTLETILLWPSADKDEVYKAQHGCIDCLALMICAELQSPESFKVTKNIGRYSGDAVPRISVLSYVIHHIVHDKNEVISSSNLGCENCASEAPLPLSFRLCMVNVLISACQKISDSRKKSFAKKVIPLLICSAEEIQNPEIRAACVHVLFSAVYHLKSAVLPYASDLFKLSLKFVEKGSEQERLAGAKLMASLMASEDSILESISGGLLEARSVLSRLSSTDPSLNLRQVCQKLLASITIT